MYFAALLARTEDGWQASDTELDDVESLADLAELAREAAVDEDTVLAFIEQEDVWFGLVRVDGEDDPRIFISDAAAAARSSYGAMLMDELLGRDRDEDDLDRLVDLDGTEEGEPEAELEEEDETTDLPLPNGPIGDTEILGDLGASEKDVLALHDDALGEIAELLGCSDVLETVR